MDGAGAVLLRYTSPPAVPLWAAGACGGCGQDFTHDPRRVPVLAGQLGRPMPTCRVCWDRRNLLRTSLGLPEEGRPWCYPEDYPQARQ